MHNLVEQQLLVQVARLYYEKGLNQEEIARRLNITRQKVSRLLGQARERGIVQITIQDPTPAQPQLAEELQEAFGLSKVLLSSGDGLDPDILRSRIGMAAADHLQEVFTDALEVGIGWGRTLYNLVNVFSIDQKVRIRVTPLIGGIGDMAPFFQINEIVRRLAEALGGTYRFLHAPAFTPDRMTYEALMRTSEVARVAQTWDHLDLAIVGIGHVELQQISSMYFAEHISPGTLAQLETKGAVGDICGRFFDINGNPVPSGEGVLGIELAQLYKVPEVIAVAGGLEKVRALLGALRGRWIKMLVTDTATARAVLKENGDRR
jgi:deoxyribonucleoside regulator